MNTGRKKSLSPALSKGEGARKGRWKGEYEMMKNVLRHSEKDALSLPIAIGTLPFGEIREGLLSPPSGGRKGGQMMNTPIPVNAGFPPPGGLKGGSIF